jgi:hypothetical protein
MEKLKLTQAQKLFLAGVVAGYFLRKWKED